jgi:hypothetical protein
LPVILYDQSNGGFGWISPEPDGMARASHALLVDGGVWLIDPVDIAGLDEQIGSLGSPRAVLQLIARHNRDSAEISARLGVPLLVAPTAVPEAPFQAIPIKGPGGWRETALWWPQRRTLIVAEAVGTALLPRTRPAARGARRPAPPAPAGGTAAVRARPHPLLPRPGAPLRRRRCAPLRRSRRELPAVLPRLLGARRHPFA